MKSSKNYYILPAAMEDYRDARNWYASRKVKGLSNRFAQAVKSTIEQILINPGAYAIRYKNVRIAHTAKFPYAIHFIAEDELIIVTAVIYDRRDIISVMEKR